MGSSEGRGSDDRVETIRVSVSPLLKFVTKLKTPPRLDFDQKLLTVCRIITLDQRKGHISTPAAVAQPSGPVGDVRF